MNRIFESIVFGAKIITPTVILKDNGKIKAQYEFLINENKGTAMLTAVHNDIFKDTLCFEFKGNEVLCRRVFENISGNKLNLCELGFEIMV